MYSPKDWQYAKTMMNNYVWTGPERVRSSSLAAGQLLTSGQDELGVQLAKRPPKRKAFRFLDLPVEIQKLIVKEYYAHKTIRAGATATKDIVHVFSNLGPLLVNHRLHVLAKEAIREAKCDTIILNHYNMYGFRRKACVDLMLDFVPEVKVAAKDIKVIRYDFGPQVRYNVLKDKFPNVERFVAVHEDGFEHAVVRHKDSWISEDLLGTSCVEA